MKKLIYILIIFLSVSNLFGQDALFTQYYSAPLYLAPSFAGGTKGSRMVMNYRNQWPGIKTTYRVFSMSYDHYFPQYSSGLGFIFLNDLAGSANLRKANTGIFYSYNFRIKRDFTIRPGLSFQYSQTSIDFNKLVFYEQLTFDGIIPQNSEAISFEKKRTLDMSMSLLFYSLDKWGGVTLDHFNNPDESLQGYMSYIPLRFRLFGGMKFYTDKRDIETNYFSTNFVFKKQGKFAQLDIGGSFFKAPFNMGLAYRGIPLRKNFQGYGNNDAISFLIGYVIQDLQIGYSYDLTLSHLISNSWGAHEISITYLFLQDQKVKNPRRNVIIPCAKF